VSNRYRIRNHYPYTGELDRVVITLTGEEDLSDPRKAESIESQ
jgi:hypothetical protein